MSKVPTITLARLYEAQDLLLDAYVVYRFVQKQQPSEEVDQTIARLENLIFEHTHHRYDQITSLLFGDDEKRIFRILPADDYSVYHAALEDIIESTPSRSTTDATSPSQPVPLSLEDILDELSSDDLSDAIHTYLDQGIKPEHVSLADLLQALQAKKIHEKEKN